MKLYWIDPVGGSNDRSPILVGMATGCRVFGRVCDAAGSGAPVETAIVAPGISAENWWYVRFRLNWPEGKEPLWSPDLLLADRVVG